MLMEALRGLRTAAAIGLILALLVALVWPPAEWAACACLLIGIGLGCVINEHDTRAWKRRGGHGRVVWRRPPGKGRPS